MKKYLLLLLLLFFSTALLAQYRSLITLLMDSSMVHSSVSISIMNTDDGNTILDFNSGKSLVPASIMKLVTTAAAIELLGPDYSFKTILGYTGKLDRSKGVLDGNIVIKGGGDPALGSEYFKEFYNEFMTSWISEIKKMGIKSITGKIISDDSYYNYEPVPPKWLWEDIGNYYGAGVYGLSAFDNTYTIILNSSNESEMPAITGIFPSEAVTGLSCGLRKNGVTDSGYVFSAPYGNFSWISGSIPSGMKEYELKASITDPPLLLARILTSRLKADGITIDGSPATTRIEKDTLAREPVVISITTSPPLGKIIEILNHESVNLYAEHLVKELGKKFLNDGSTASGLKVIDRFLEDSAGIKAGGIIMTDGSGLSPADGIDSKDLTLLLLYMKKRARFFNEFYSSLPVAGKEGTLKNRFRDPVFNSRLRAKSGSMTRVRSYAGYLVAKSGNELAFSIIINNFIGPSQSVVSSIEDLLREIAIQN